MRPHIPNCQCDQCYVEEIVNTPDDPQRVFWMIIHGNLDPGIRQYTDEQGAINEAKRLAKMNPQLTYYVVKAIMKVSITACPVVVTPLLETKS